MADTYEQNLGQKSSLTTSDYIRVVGSDNVSYKQPVTSVLALNGTFYDGSWKANADLNYFKTNGVYWISTGATNAPAGNWYPLLVMSKNDTIRQIAIVGNDTIHSRAYQSSAWSSWIRLPSRTEIDALNSNKISGSLAQLASPISASGQYTLDEPYNNYKLLYILMFKGSTIYSSVFHTDLLGAGYIASISQGGYSIGITFTNSTTVSVTMSGAPSIRIYGIK